MMTLMIALLTAANPPEVYDNFDAAKHIDGTRWRIAESASLLAPPLEAVHAIQLGQLHLSSQAYALAEGGITLARPRAVTTLHAKVQIEQLRAKTGGTARIALGGRWFRSAPITSGAAGDIAAVVEVTR